MMNLFNLSRPWARRQMMRASILAVALSGLSALPSVSLAQTAPVPNPHEAIYMYKGADREAWLLERARKEGGVVTFYSSLSPTEATPLMREFEKKYGIKV